MSLKQNLLTLFVCFVAFNATSQENIDETFGNGIINKVAKDSSFSVTFGARFQTLYSYQLEQSEFDEYDIEDSDFLIRRARLKFDGFAYSPKLEYKIELGLSNRDISGGNEFTGNTPRYILDAVLKWNFYENFVLWAGQAKLPGNRERVVSSGDLQIVDRSMLNSRFTIDRDLGVQLRHKTRLGEQVILKEIFALSQGEGRNITSGNLGGNQYTGRLELLPFGEFEDYEEADLERNQKPKLALGVTYDYNNDAVKTRSNMGNYMRVGSDFFASDIETVFADLMFKYRGFSVLSEYALRDADNPIARDENGLATGDVINTGTSVNVQAGYLLGNNYEVVSRFTNVNEDDPNSLFRNENQYTLGLSKYFVGHKLKIQTDCSFNDSPEPLRKGFMYRLQVDLHL